MQIREGRARRGRDSGSAFPVYRPRGSQRDGVGVASLDMRQTDGVVGQAFGDEALPSDHARALHAAVHEFIDQFCEDVASLVDAPQKVEETSMSQYLPRCYQGRYSPLFAKRFLMATATVAWKLAQHQWHHPACIAEELALNAMIRRETLSEGARKEGR
jgi:hypothetical protein